MVAHLGFNNILGNVQTYAARSALLGTSCAAIACILRSVLLSDMYIFYMCVVHSMLLFWRGAMTYLDAMYIYVILWLVYEGFEGFLSTAPLLRAHSYSDVVYDCRSPFTRFF